LLHAFEDDPDFQQIEGDLLEEFNHRLRASGARAASRWYQREALRNLWVLLMNRPGSLRVLLLSAFSAAVLLYAYLPWIYWLHGASRMPGLALVLIAVTRTLTGLALGVFVSRVATYREFRTRLVITSVYAVVWASSVIRLLPLHYSLMMFALGVAGCHLTALTGFWIGSRWMSRRLHLATGA
jgi:hypothetical protein